MNGFKKIEKLANKYSIKTENTETIDIIGNLLFEMNCEIDLLKNKKEDRLVESDSERKRKGKGIPVWKAYCEAYKNVYKIEPVRNMTVNIACSNLVKRLGEELAVKVVQFYLTQRDPFFTKNAHDIKFCLNSCEALATKMKTGLSLTNKQAKRVETAAHNAKITENYLRKKRSGTNGILD